MTHRFFRGPPSLTGVWLAALVALSLAGTAVASMDAPQNTPTPLALKASATPHPGFGTTGQVAVADDVNVADMITTEDGSLLVIGEGDQAGRLVFVSTLPDVIFQDRFQ